MRSSPRWPGNAGPQMERTERRSGRPVAINTSAAVDRNGTVLCNTSCNCRVSSSPVPARKGVSDEPALLTNSLDWWRRTISRLRARKRAARSTAKKLPIGGARATRDDLERTPPRPCRCSPCGGRSRDSSPRRSPRRRAFQVSRGRADRAAERVRKPRSRVTNRSHPRARVIAGGFWCGSRAQTAPAPRRAE